MIKDNSYPAFISQEETPEEMPEIPETPEEKPAEGDAETEGGVSETPEEEDSGF